MATKRAYLLTFHATTRIVVDSDSDPFINDELLFKMCENARETMRCDLEGYLDADNAEIEDDLEMPYTPDYDDYNEDTFVKY